MEENYKSSRDITLRALNKFIRAAKISKNWLRLMNCMSLKKYAHKTV